MSLALKVLKEAALSKVRSRVRHLILHVTNLCNFRCQHCFVDFKKQPEDLTLEEVREVARVFPRLLWLDIGGGEPFLRKDLPEILALFQAEEYSIPTNGWFTETTLDTIARLETGMDLKKLILAVSLDGLGGTHDAIRCKKGSFDRALVTFREIRARFPDLRLKINTVLNHRNVDEVLPLMHFVRDYLRPDFHSILFLRGTPINPDYRLPDTAAIRALEDSIFQIQQGYTYGRTGLLSQVQRHYQSIKRELSTQILETKSQRVPCLGGQAHAVVYANGDVAPCEILPSVGNLRATRLPEILTGEGWRQSVERIRAKECFCTHDCNMVENILFRVRLYPRLLLGTKPC